MSQNTSTVRFSEATAFKKPIASYIDSTKLTYNPGENHQDAITHLCQEAIANHFFAVCVRPDMISLSKQILANSGVAVATVIGFPQGKMELATEQQTPTVGSASLQDKLSELQQALKDSADEFDVVLNVAQFKNDIHHGNLSATVNELSRLKQAAGTKLVKVIIETDLLSKHEIEEATSACAQAGIDMVKTSTGMLNGGVGATPENITIIHDTLHRLGKDQQMGIKASGGIKTLAQVNALIQAGATRIGTSQGANILQ